MRVICNNLYVKKMLFYYHTFLPSVWQSQGDKINKSDLRHFKKGIYDWIRLSIKESDLFLIVTVTLIVSLFTQTH